MSENPINLSDFDSVTLSVALINEANRMELRYGRQIFRDKNFTLRLPRQPHRPVKLGQPGRFDVLFSEFLDDGLVLDVPKGTCARDNRLILLVEVSGGSHDMDFDTEGVVTGVAPSAPGRDTVRVRIENYDEGEWSRLRSVFSDRQDAITEFFDAVKD